MFKIIYAFFLGILLATFIGVGIAALYPAPEGPQYPKTLERVDSTPLTEAERAEQENYNEQSRVFQEQLSVYNRNVSIITIVFAIIFMVGGLILEAKIGVISEGLLLGGVFTLLYGIGRGFASEDEIYRFIVVSVGVTVALVLGYLKFSKPVTKK